ncbi:TadE/TadG family type IV pilus assembly protein [Trinickia acidisoli]|uniref:TadE/TadG family type IV pilus assembly protein n=1 Tax=Trinickia acidisoli TaxID=2767482 RepID=UPI001F5DA5B2|nr:TadE/TadG family type IV pilus assembly protein [Trinickia acidisoli]
MHKVSPSLERNAGRRFVAAVAQLLGAIMNNRLSTRIGFRVPPRTSGRVARAHVRRRNQRGSAVVEFALLLPLLLVITFGIIEFALALYDKAVITNASREAARAGIVYESPQLTNTQISAVATNYCANYLIALGSKPTPTVTVSHSSGTSAGNPLTVTVSYGYTSLGMSSVLDPMPSLLSMSATTTMNYE